MTEHWGDRIARQARTTGPLALGIDPSPDDAPAALVVDAALFLRRYTSALLEAAAGDVAFVKFQSAALRPEPVG